MDEIGLFFTEPVREAMNFETMRGDGLNTSFWNLQSAIYSMWAGELAAVDPENTSWRRLAERFGAMAGGR